MNRQSGILLHPSSLPGPDGIGTFGDEAYRFIDYLIEAGQTLWQVLPIGPTGYGDSPYAAFSTFAGNPMLISLDRLHSQDYLLSKELTNIPSQDPTKIDFGALIPWKQRLLSLAAARFIDGASESNINSFNHFCHEEAWWLQDYVLFMDIKEYYDRRARDEGRHGAMWSNFWPPELALREESAIKEWINDPEHIHSMDIRRVIQYFFFSQWTALKNYANQRGVSIIGDLPIFVAADSVDVWANRELFQLDASGKPDAVAGVPPDYFSKTGQLWGNPLYAWERHAERDFSWWIQRIQGNLRLFDWLRIDHFRGFEAYWSVPTDQKTAEHGHWEKAPGSEFFRKLKHRLGDLPILAEDLGFITHEVRELRDSFELPGMKILQFAFDADESGKGLNSQNGFLPHMYTPKSIVYTGTHDNDTLKGWIEKAKPEELDFIRQYLGYNPSNFVDALIRLALSSVSTFTVIPMQDILELGSEARMNIPSTLGGNWTWRIRSAEFTKESAEKIRKLSSLYGRNSIRD